MNRTAANPGLLPLLSMLVILVSSGVARAGVNTWTFHGPLGAVVQTLVVDPATPSTLYAVASGGVSKSTDGGNSWITRNDGLGGNTVRTLAIDPVNPGRLYAGTAFDGVYKSVNGGGSWTSSNGGMTSPNVEALVIDPTNPATLYVGTFEYGCEGPCLFKSTNGGGIWVPTGRAPDVLSLAIDPVTTTTLYVGTYGSGVFKSVDAGDSWVAAGLAGKFVFSLAVDPSSPATLYAGTSTGIFKSIDGGGSWTASTVGVPGISFVRALAINPLMPTTLYAGLEGGGVFRSRNGGETWTPLNDGLTNRNVMALAIDPSNPARLYAGTNGSGVFEYLDASAPGLCAPSPTTLCLNGGRFAVTTRWATRDGQTGSGQAVALTGITGYFTFFDAANVEMMVKVLNGCGTNSHYWTFAGGLTDVEVVLTVTDGQNGAVRTYTNPLGNPFHPIQDTGAFATCP